MLTIHFSNVGENLLNFHFETHQINRDILTRAIHRLGSINDLNIAIDYQEDMKVGTIIDSHGCECGQFHVVDSL